MHRRPIDVVFSIGFFAAAALLAIVGFVLADNSHFLDSSVSAQISDLNLAFPTMDVMTEDQQTIPCVVANASKLVRTESQARCYAENLTDKRVAIKSLLMTDVTLAGMGDRTRYIADVAYMAAAVFTLAGLAGLAHWSTSEETATVASPPARKVRRHAAAA
jgi:hypothetical protein